MIPPLPSTLKEILFIYKPNTCARLAYLQVEEEVSVHDLSPPKLSGKLLQMVALSHVVDTLQVLAVVIVGDTGVHGIAADVDDWEK